MTRIKVLGPGWSSCARTVRLIERVAQAEGADVQLEKEADLTAIMAYGALSTPGVVLDDELVHAGGVPTEEQVRAWLTGS